MKKILLVIALCFAFPVVGNAVTCWGSPVTGNNGHTYCVSTQNMKWLAALAWCDAQGRRLATIHEACDYNGNVYGTNSTGCNNMQNNKLSSQAWVSTPCVNSWGGTASYYVQDGVECPINAGRGQLWRALCY